MKSKTGKKITEKLKLLWHDTKQDFGLTDLKGKLFLTSLVAMTAYEWGPGNETLTPIITGQALGFANGSFGVLITAGVAGSFTYFQQLLSGWLTRRSIEQFPRSAKTSYKIMNDENSAKDENRFKPYIKLPLIKQMLYGFLVGTSFNVLRESMVTGSNSQEPLKHIVRRSAFLVALVVFIIAGCADIVDQVAPANSAVQAVINILKTPWPWLILMATILSKDYLITKLHREQA